ncbi:hypothetical protein [Pinirhizobacter soli]|uniref:hypothetical protein n=1 Tax=Pinirhizobacter soli TaxID=2786953 RepID=UPI002029F316|nr:hypothetical protein [Pinirhizobacter soli]
MFGWLATFGAPRREHPSAVQTRWLRLGPQALARTLPTLGSVLHLPRLRCAPCLTHLPRGVIAGDALVAPLLATRLVGAGSAVTADGPREWLEYVDASGICLARTYLLPDTDYLGWDALLAEGEPIGADEWTPVEQGFTAAQARVIRFDTNIVGGLRLLRSTGACTVSPMGRSLAGSIAQAQSVAYL